MPGRRDAGDPVTSTATPTELSVRPLLALAAGRAMALVVTFATPLVLVRVFDQAGFGTYKQLFLIGGTLSVIAQLGMAESLLYFLPSAPKDGGRYVLNALLVLGGSGLACLGLFLALGPLLPRWLGNASLSGLSRLLGGYVALTLPAAVLEIVLTARKRFGGAGAAYGLSDLVRALAVVAPAVLTGKLAWLLAGAAAFAAVRLGATLLYLRSEFGAELRPDGALLRKQLAYALPFQLGGALWILVLNLHYYLVASFVDAATFAIYAVGCLQIPLIELLFTPAKNIMMVRMREAITAHRPGAPITIWRDTVGKLAVFFFPLVGLLLVTAHELIPFLFTERYAASTPIFMIWSTIILIEDLARIAVERDDHERAARLLGAAANLREEAGAAPLPPEREVLDRLGGSVRGSLGAAAFETAFQAGQALSLSEALDFAHTMVGEPAPATGRAAGVPLLRVNALGPLEISVDGAQLPAAAWSSAQPRELLLYLVCHPGGRTRDQIGLALWGDVSPAQRKNDFHITLHQLRSTLGRPDWIVFEEERYRINPRLPVEFDGRQFEADVRAARAALAKSGDAAPLARALARYRGDFLEDAGTGAGAGDWHLEYRDRWHRLYVEGQLALAEGL